MNTVIAAVLSLAAAGFLVLAAYVVHLAFIGPWLNPITRLPGPPGNRLIEMRHVMQVVDPRQSPHTHVRFVKNYGRNVYIRGPFPWDQRLFTLDPKAINHILQNSTLYEKPEPSRRLISNLIGVGMLSAEGVTHKRQRRVAMAAFSIQTIRALVPLAFSKGLTLKDKWAHVIRADGGEKSVIDVCDWASRATFDMIGSAGFDYEFNAIQGGDDELLRAYVDMFDAVLSKNKRPFWRTIALYWPILDRIFPDETTRFTAKCRAVIDRIAGDLIQEKKRKIAEAEEKGQNYQGKDLLTLLLKSNSSTEIPPEQRISDEDILHTINTFMFAGTDTTSLALTWTIYLLSHFADVQTRLRNDLMALLPDTPLEKLTQEETQSLYAAIAEVPYLDNVIKETLRVIPPMHSSIRVATQDDAVPISSPIKRKDELGNIVLDEATRVFVPKGTMIHVPVEGFNLDKEFWGETAWNFNPDRWDDLPETVKDLPGLYNHLLTFSAGPRACMGMRMSLIEIKAFIFILLTNYTFSPSPEHKIGKANVVLTRPFVIGRENEGSMLPVIVTPYVRPVT
ncbi:cytochrome P450 [Trametopsis cervina]|nr:cytochrome P450 [Trametopsis cervina]